MWVQDILACTVLSFLKERHLARWTDYPVSVNGRMPNHAATMNTEWLYQGNS